MRTKRTLPLAPLHPQKKAAKTTLEKNSSLQDIIKLQNSILIDVSDNLHLKTFNIQYLRNRKSILYFDKIQVLSRLPDNCV